MRHLMLLRHAKSAWTETGMDDRDRPLTPRGQRAAQAMGQVMLDRGLLPDLVLCSPAKRARETWALVAEGLKTAPKMLVDEAIYDFGNGGRIAKAVAQRGGDAATVLIVGHNPSLERLANRLAKTGAHKLRDRLEKKFPTAALTVIDFDIEDWAALDGATGDLSHFIRPRDVLATGQD